MINFNKKEIIYIILSAIVLSFVFTFDKWGGATFDLSAGLKNLILFTVLIGIFILLKEFGRKLVAGRYDASVEYTLWQIERLSLYSKAKFKKPVPIGVILSLIVALITAGKVFFCAIGSFRISRVLVTRLGKKPDLMEYELSKIALAAPVTSLLIALVLKFFVGYFDYNLMELVKINVYLAFFHMLPLPGLDGIKIFFGSRYLYIFSLVFIGVAGFLLFHLSVLATVLLALALAIVLASAFYFIEVFPSLKP